jgi:glycerophosphoryl diester phosphodiesterase
MFQEAERKARLRDIKNEKVLTEEELRQANELQAKANARGMKLVPERKVKNKARFVQIIQENWTYLQKEQYLKNEEIVFLMSLIPFIGFGSNAIVDDPKKKQPLPITQRELARALGTSETKVSRVVKGLFLKGIIAKAESCVENSNVKSYALFVNPHVLYAGDRDNIEEGLKIQFVKLMKAKVLKDLPIKFF